MNSATKMLRITPFFYSVECNQDYLLTDVSFIDSEISVASDQEIQVSESLLDRVAALVDIIPPSTRSKISNTSSSIASFTSSALSFTGKGLWVVSTSVLLLGIPYALAFGQEQEIMEREREEGLMREGASSVS